MPKCRPIPKALTMAETEMSADTEISAETDTKTDNFRSLVISITFFPLSAVMACRTFSYEKKLTFSTVTLLIQQSGLSGISVSFKKCYFGKLSRMLNR